MQVNNTVYEEFGHLWWNDDAGFEITSLRFCMNPVRYGYFKRQLQALGIRGGKVLDVGSGGGFLAEEFAKDGYDVTGIDPAANSIACAAEHAARMGLAIQYRVARGESLPFADASFDIVACCDVLEHVDEPAQVIHEISRTLRPGGILLYDTVNRTLRSRIVLIKLWQDWRVTGANWRNVHVWEKFIRPDELKSMMRSAGLEPGPISGIGSAKGPLALLHSLWRIRNGRVPASGVGEAFPMCESSDLSVSYVGWARKQKLPFQSSAPMRR